MANSGDKFLYFLIGGFVGASVALLFAPKTGEDTRHYLESKYREGTGELGKRVKAGKDYISETREGLSERVSESLHKSRDAVNRQKDQISSAIEAGKKAYNEEKSKLEQSEG